MAATGVTGGSRAPPGRPPPGAPYAVELRGITKRFPGVVANRDIELRVRRGEVHAIVGENGAGKSTLMKTLYGDAPPRRGHDPRSTAARSASAARPTRSPPASAWSTSTSCWPTTSPSSRTSSSAASPPRAAGWTAPRRRRRIREISDRYALDLDPDDLVEDLGVGDRQRVEIAKVLYREARILILDEPTAVLVPQEVDELFGNLAELKREGLTVIFISHKLDEVRKVADSITVIRRGTTVGTADPKTTTARQLAEMMVGSELPSPETRTSTVRDDRRPRAARRDRRRRRTGRPLVDDVEPRPSARARSWASPASRATARPSSSTRSWACGRWPAGTRPARRRRHHAPGAPARGARPGVGLHPGGPAPAGHAARRHAVGEPDPRPPDPPAGGEGLRSSTARRPRRHRADHAASTTSAPPARTRSPSRCPAATSRS